MKMMEFDISGVNQGVEEIIKSLWNAPETSKVLSQGLEEEGAAPITNEEARLILEAADPSRTGMIRLEVVQRPAVDAMPSNPQYIYQPNQYRRSANKPQANLRHFYITIKGKWRSSQLNPRKDGFQALRLQFRMNRQGNSFFKYHDPNLARQILIGDFKAIELVDCLEEDDLEEYPQYIALLRRVDYQAVLFVRSLLSDYFKQEKPTPRKVKTNRFLGMRKQNTFYTKPTQTGYSLNTLTLMKTAFLVQLRAAVQKRVEMLDFFEMAQPETECFKRLQCSYLVLGGDLDMLLEDLNNKNHYHTHSDPKPLLLEGEEPMMESDLESIQSHSFQEEEEGDHFNEDDDFEEDEDENEDDNRGNCLLSTSSQHSDRSRR